MRTAPGLIVSAAASGSGKTVFTLALLRALKRRGTIVASAKVGPDYIDPAFHTAAGGRACVNLDGWAMRPATIAARVGELSRRADLIVCEGVMGLFDGAAVPPGAANGSTAELAARTRWPVLLLVDLRGQAASAAALIQGFRRHQSGVAVTGVVFNRVGGENHRSMVEAACAESCPDLPLLGWLPRHPDLALPERHLGLVQAGEIDDLDRRLDAAADLVERHVDLDRLTALALPSPLTGRRSSPPLPPLGQRIGLAQDQAFAFAYPDVLDGWRRAGAEIQTFSPLADQPVPAGVDAVYLPGGYPELHAGRLAAAGAFLDSLRRAALSGYWIYGECGGFMSLGQVLEDAEGRAHAMAGLLPVSTSFARRKLHLGYRECRLLVDTPFGKAGTTYRGHEFHYATITNAKAERPLFATADAYGRDRHTSGLMVGTVMGSFIHLLDKASS